MATDYNSKYSGEQVEALLDQVASGNAGGGGGGGIAVETDPIFSASPAATITENDKAVWSGKQDSITDLSAIREGASKGATAVQPSSLAKVATSGSYNDLSNKPTIPNYDSILDMGFLTEENVAVVAMSGSYNNLSDTPDIPTEATISGWGFTKNAGTYSKPSGGIPRSDLDNEVITALRKAEQYTGTLTDVKMNGSALGANAGVVDIGNVVTSVKVNNATKSPSGGVVDLGSVGTYSKPSGGIPKTDLASDVQTLLDKANVAVTKDNIGGLDTIQTQGFNGSLNDMLYALPDEANGNEDDILLSRDTVKTINGQSIFGSGNIEISGGGSSSGGGNKEIIEWGENYLYDAEPNKIYICDPFAYLTITLAPTDALVDEWVFHIVNCSSLILPDNVLWAGGEAPNMPEYGSSGPEQMLEVSIVKTRVTGYGDDIEFYKAVGVLFTKE